jgi:hypothetical protein
MEVEWANDYSFSSDNYTMPSTIKYTPQGRHILWGRTEFSAGFDTVSTAVENDARIAHFSDRFNFAATCVLLDGEKLDIAIAPQASMFLRGDSGMRIGATAIARYDSGRNSTGITVGWSGATVASSNESLWNARRWRWLWKAAEGLRISGTFHSARQCNL